MQCFVNYFAHIFILNSHICIFVYSFILLALILCGCAVIYLAGLLLMIIRVVTKTHIFILSSMLLA